MAYPPAYTRTFSFTDWETLHPDEPKPGPQLDAEYDGVSNALTATQTNLALIQRADGALSNDSVGEDQLQDGIFDGIADGITADAEAAAAAAQASATAAATSASQASASAASASTSAATASGAAAQAGVSQGIAQNAANEADISADTAFDHSQVAANAGNEAQGFRNEAEGFAEIAFDWAEKLEGPVMPAPPGWPEAVDDGMFSAKWWAIRARDYNATDTIDLGTAGADIGEAFDIWDAIPGNDLGIGQTYATWGTPPHTYVLTDPSDPSDPNSWTDITGGPGPAGPPNTLAIGTVTSGFPTTATITGISPNQVLNLVIEPGATGATGPVGPQGPAGIASFADPTVLVDLVMQPGDSTDAMRSDAAPALSQAILPTWTGEHRFSGTVVGTLPTTLNGVAIARSAAGDPAIWFRNAGGAVHQKNWSIVTSSAALVFVLYDDAGANPKSIAQFARTAGAVSSLAFGNAVDNPNYSFTGSGTASFPCTVDFTGPLKAGSVEGLNGQVLASQGAGLPPIWRSPGGGSVDLIFAFSTSTAAADPGAQKCAFNNAAYASVTQIYYDITSQTNFDASTILSLLTTGNRIYMQQRNDASRAAIYQVTGPATNMGGTGWFSVPVTVVNSQGAMFANNADVTSVFLLSVSSGTALANPTATIGLTAVNGVAATAMRSDGAPALSQAIAPTWTATHTFTPSSGAAILVNGLAGTNCMQVLGANSVNNSFGVLITAGMSASDMTLQLRSRNTGNRNYLLVKGDGAIEFGNTTDNPTYNFLGTGLTTFTGSVALSNPGPLLRLIESDQAGTDEKNWGVFVSAKTFQLRSYDDTFNTARIILNATRGTGMAITAIQIGNATDNQAFTVLGSGLTQINGSAVIGAASGGNMGVGTLNATGLFVNGVAVGGGASGANPTGTVQLTAVNGSAGTFMRSDAAPALNQNISPNWTGTHTFSGAAPQIQFFENDQGTDELYWRVRVETKIMRFETWDTALTAGHAGLQIARGTGNTVASLTFGNVGDAPAYTFAGTGLTTFNGGVVLGAPTGGNKGVGTINAASNIYVNNVAVATGTIPTAANPTASLGLTAVNGSASTYMRSDGAPALSQSISPTWSGTHTFSAGVAGGTGPIVLASATPGLVWNETDVAADNRIWRQYVNGAGWNLETMDDALAVSKRVLAFVRTANVVTSLSFGNATDNPTFAFLGTGAITAGPSMTLNSAAGVIRDYGYSTAGVLRWSIRVNGTAEGGSNAGSDFQILRRDDAGVSLGAWLSVTRSTGAASFDGSAFTFNTGTIRAIDGSAAVPAYTFTNDPDTGLWRNGSNSFVAIAGGVAIATFNYPGGFAQFCIQPGSASIPSLAVDGDRDTGIYPDTSDSLAVTTGGIARLLIRGSGNVSSVDVSAPSFTTTSSRTIKRETGKPKRAADILSKLRPLLYRLLDGDDREQLGLIAEEVHEVCPQLSNGKAVAYDRLAILLLAAWQEEHAEVA